LIRLLLRQLFLGLTSGIQYEFLCCTMQYNFLLFSVMFPDCDFFVDLIKKFDSELYHSSSFIGLPVTTMEPANLQVKSFRWSRKRV